MDIIKSIRRDQGLDIQVAEPDAKAAIQHLRRNLENALHNLSEDLYSKSTHFLLEFIQNADDNSYPQGVQPALEIQLLDQNMTIKCNEGGFSDRDVRAICSVGESTKKNQLGYIGEKGIGFKSVFTVAKVVEVRSGQYTFKFDKSTDLGMIAPIWTGPCVTEPGWTSFHLTLSSTQLLMNHLNGIQPTLLLFLRKLRSIRLDIKGRIRTFQRHDLTEDVVRVEETEGAAKEYLIIKRITQTYSKEEKREGITKSELVLAFPISADGAPVAKDQMVYAFLPLRSFGLPFIIQADFLTASGREDILSDRQWNIVLRNAIAPAFLQAVERFHQRPNLEFDWFQYIPRHIPPGFMRPIRSSILEILKRSPLFLCRDGVRRAGTSVIVPLAEYKDHDGNPLVPEKYIRKKYYLSAQYSTDRHGATLEELGVELMSPSAFVDALREMDKDGSLQKQSAEWYNHVCFTLQPILARRRKLRKPISELRIIPLTQQRSWVNASAGNVFFDSHLGDVPQDMDINLVASQVSNKSYHYRLLRDLDVKEADVSNIAHQLLSLHSNPSLDTRHHSALPSHARFLFRHESELSLSAGFPFWVLTRNGDIIRANDAYMNHSSYQSPSLEEYFQSTHGRFLHNDYFDVTRTSSRWNSFLRSRLGLNISPRVVNNALSPEFENFLANSDTTTILSFLKTFWSDLAPKLEDSSDSLKQLQGVRVRTSDGALRAFDKSFIARNTLRRFTDLPFIVVQDPENKSWDFLRKLGVSFEVDSIFYLNRLVHLSDTYPAEAIPEEQVYECYQQLEARFEDDAKSNRIRTAFIQLPLIYVRKAFMPPTTAPKTKSGRWLSSASVVWSGPTSMRSKFALDREGAYPMLKKLFCSYLSIPGCPEDILLQEMKLLASECGDIPLSADQERQAHDILCDVSAVVSGSLTTSHSNSVKWLSSLRDVPAFPVRTAGGIKLAKFTDGFYIRDRSGELAGLFQADVPILTLPPMGSKGYFTHFYELFRSEWFKDVKYLESSVVQAIQTTGDRIPDMACSDQYLSRVPYINRLVCASAKLMFASRIPSFMAKLQDVGVYEVDSVNVSYSLGDVTRILEQDLAVEATAKRFIVLVSKKCLREERDILFAQKLAEHFPGLETDAICVLLSIPTPSIGVYLKQKGMSLEDQDMNGSPLFDATWFTDARQGTSPQTEKSKLPAGAGRQAASSSQPKSSSSTVRHDLNMLLAQRIPGILKAAAQQSITSAVCNLESLQSIFESVADEESWSTGSSYVVKTSASNARIAKKGVAGSDKVSGTIGKGRGVKVSGGDSASSAEEALDGILGEIYVYNVLERDLPEFDCDNWTSELRCHMPEFPPFVDTSQADFTYHDRTGTFTAKLFGDKGHAAWMEVGYWPTYHLEVKATSGSLATPFHMSRRQLQIATRMSAHRSETPENIYVIVRVSSVRSNPSLQLYPDPHRLLYEGGLQFFSDVELVAL